MLWKTEIEMIIISFHTPMDWLVYSLAWSLLIFGNFWNIVIHSNKLLPSKFLDLYSLNAFFLYPTLATHSEASILDFIITIFSDHSFKHLSDDYFIFWPDMPLFLIQQFSKCIDKCLLSTVTYLLSPVL